MSQTAAVSTAPQRAAKGRRPAVAFARRPRRRRRTAATTMLVTAAMTVPVLPTFSAPTPGNVSSQRNPVLPLCPAGTYLEPTGMIECLPCLSGVSYTPTANRNAECFECLTCRGLIVESPCNATHNTGCRCPPGQYLNVDGGCTMETPRSENGTDHSTKSSRATDTAANLDEKGPSCEQEFPFAGIITALLLLILFVTIIILVILSNVYFKCCKWRSKSLRFPSHGNPNDASTMPLIKNRDTVSGLSNGTETDESRTTQSNCTQIDEPGTTQPNCTQTDEAQNMQPKGTQTDEPRTMQSKGTQTYEPRTWQTNGTQTDDHQTAKPSGTQTDEPPTMQPKGTQTDGRSTQLNIPFCAEIEDKWDHKATEHTLTEEMQDANHKLCRANETTALHQRVQNVPFGLATISAPVVGLQQCKRRASMVANDDLAVDPNFSGCGSARQVTGNSNRLTHHSGSCTEQREASRVIPSTSPTEAQDPEVKSPPENGQQQTNNTI